MDPLTMLITALLAGAAAATTDTASQAIKDSYNALKNLIVKKFGSTTDIEDAVKSVEKNPTSKSRAGVLQEELVKSKVDQDSEVQGQAEILLEMLKDAGVVGDGNYQATLTGGGAIAQGKGSTAVGTGGIYVGRDSVSDSYNQGESMNSKSISSVCPKCGNKIRVKEQMIMGQQLICPSCKTQLSTIETNPLLFDIA